MTPLEIDEMLRRMSHEEKAHMLAVLDELEHRKRITLCQTDFLAFIGAIDGNYKFGAHLKRLGHLLMDVECGVKDRIAVSMAPRFGKSQMISIYYPAWYLGRHPDHMLILASHTADLAVDLARKVRNLMSSAEYKAIFPGVNLAADAKAAGKWNTTKGGEVFATGVGGAVAGRGANLCLDGNSIVLIDGVPTKLRDVQIGQYIHTAFGRERVTKKILTIHSERFKINSVVCSLDHPFLTPRGWVLASDLRVGDKILTLSLWRRLWITANSLLKRLRARRGKA